MATIDPKTGKVIYDDGRAKGEARTGTTEPTTPPPEMESVITPEMQQRLEQIQAENAILAAGGDPRLRRGGSNRYRYSKSRVEEAFRRYDEIMDANARGRRHPLMQDLLLGANRYWTDLGFASERGGPDGRGFFDKQAAKDYVRRKFGPNQYSEGTSTRPTAFAAGAPAPGTQAAQTSSGAASDPYFRNRFASLLAKARATGGRGLTAQEMSFLLSRDNMVKYYGSIEAASGKPATTTPAPTATGNLPPASAATGNNDDKFSASEATATTQNPAGPGTAAAQAATGAANGANNTPTVDAQKEQNQQTQFRSSRTGFSGNRRFHPFGGR